MNRSRLHEAFSLQLKRKEKVEHHFAQAPTVACEYSRLSSLLATGMFRGRGSIKIEVASRFEKSQ